jgi:DnaD/phage-associated family protein
VDNIRLKQKINGVWGVARKRMIDPNIWTSEDVARLTIFERLLLIGMFSNSDDYGKGRANTTFLRSIIFPYDDVDLKKIEEALGRIKANIGIILYEINGSKYYKFLNWVKWQKVEKPQPSKIPEPIEQLEEESGNDSGNDRGRREVNISKYNISKDNIKQQQQKEKTEEEKPLTLQQGKNDFEKKYFECFGTMITIAILQEIREFLNDNLDAALIIETMHDAARANARSWNYSKKILNTCVLDKILTLEQYKIKQLDYENKKKQQGVVQNGTANTDKRVDKWDLSNMSEATRRKIQRDSEAAI